MGLLDAATAPLRYALNAAAGEVEKAEPVKELTDVQIHVVHAIETIKDATTQIEKQVESLDKLVGALAPLVEQTLPALTAAVQQLTVELAAVKPLSESVVELTGKLNVVSGALAPVATVEQDLGRLGHLFRVRR